MQARKRPKIPTKSLKSHPFVTALAAHTRSGTNLRGNGHCRKPSATSSNAYAAGPKRAVSSLRLPFLLSICSNFVLLTCIRPRGRKAGTRTSSKCTRAREGTPKKCLLFYLGTRDFCSVFAHRLFSAVWSPRVWSGPPTSRWRSEHQKKIGTSCRTHALFYAVLCIHPWRRHELELTTLKKNKKYTNRGRIRCDWPCVAVRYNTRHPKHLTCTV